MSHDVSEADNMVEKVQIPVNGLHIGPNDITKPAGTFLWADNVVHRRNGVLEPLEEPQPYAGVIQPSSITDVVDVYADWDAPFFAAFEADGGLVKLRFSDTVAAWNNVSVGNGTQALRFYPGRTRGTYSRRRFLFSGGFQPGSFENVLSPVVAVDDFPKENEFQTHTHGDPRFAGVAPPTSVKATVLATTTLDSAVVFANEYVAYCVVLRRKTSDAYITSAPSVKVRTPEVSLPRYVRVDISWGTGYDVKLGDELVVFRTRKATATPDALNDTYYRAGSVKVESSHITAGGVSWEDQVPETGLGEELYTNPGAQGSLAANLPPPASRGIETFKATTFYLVDRTTPAVALTLGGNYNGLDPAFGSRNIAVTVSGSTLTPSSPADLRAVGVGQKVSIVGSSLTAAARVATIGPSSFTLTENPGVSGAQTAFVTDTITVEAFREGALKATTEVVASQSFIDAMLSDVKTGGVRGLKMEMDVPGVNLGGGDVVVTPTFLFSSTIPGLYDELKVTVPVGRRWDATVQPNGTGVATSSQTHPKNLIAFSKTDEPEHVPPVNYLSVGTGTCYRMAALENSLLVFCSDGIYRVTGAGNQWSINQISKTDILMHPNAVDVFENIAWAWVEHGLAAATEQGVEVISEDAIGPDLETATRSYSSLDDLRRTWGTHVKVDRINREVRFQCTNPYTAQWAFSYIFNVRTKMWTQIRPNNGLERGWSGGYSRTKRAFIEGRSGGYYLAEPGFYRASAIVYNVMTEPSSAFLKEFVDMNWFVDFLESTDGQPVDIHFLYGGADSGGLETRTQLDLEKARPVNHLVLEAADTGRAFAAHSLVPRRAGRSTELVAGIQFTANAYYQLKGAALKYRNASNIVKR